MTISTVQSNLLSEEDRERVREALLRIEKDAELPLSVQEPVLRLLRLVSEGRGAAVLETERDLTSTEAANLLGVSRPFLTKLLDGGRIPFHRTGRDRRIAASDIVLFKERRDEEKRRRAEAFATRAKRDSQRMAAAAGVTVDEAEELGFG